MRRRFIIFSSVLFLLILILGSSTFIVLMERIQYKNSGYELMRIIQIEQFKLEASMNSEIAMYQNYLGSAELYFFNAAGEITGADDVSLVENKINITKALGQAGEEILAKAKGLKTNEVKYFWGKTEKQVTAVGSIPSLDWYAAAVHSFSIGDFLHTGMTVLFAVMMTVIFSVFVVFNIFIVGMLEPLKRMIKTINQALSDWEIKPHENNNQNDEIETLGEFLNMTVIDQLTGIYNRRYMDGYLKMIINSLARNAGRLSLLMIDIDYFKKYNDTYGHDAGDNCLKTVAAALSQCITRSDDFIARYGGEEFTVILPNTDKNGAQLIAEKLLEKIRECNIPHKASCIADHITISIGGTTGIVKHLHHGRDYIKAADKALYESKKNGRSRYTFKVFEG
jgi:diguanylate cyclase (GGDEF)-like protein